MRWMERIVTDFGKSLEMQDMYENIAKFTSSKKETQATRNDPMDLE